MRIWLFGLWPVRHHRHSERCTGFDFPPYNDGVAEICSCTDIMRGKLAESERRNTERREVSSVDTTVVQIPWSGYTKVALQVIDVVVERSKSSPMLYHPFSSCFYPFVTLHIPCDLAVAVHVIVMSRWFSKAIWLAESGKVSAPENLKSILHSNRASGSETRMQKWKHEDAVLPASNGSIYKLYICI